MSKKNPNPKTITYTEWPLFVLICGIGGGLNFCAVWLRLLCFVSMRLEVASGASELADWFPVAAATEERESV